MIFPEGDLLRSLLPIDFLLLDDFSDHLLDFQKSLVLFLRSDSLGPAVYISLHLEIFLLEGRLYLEC